MPPHRAAAGQVGGSGTPTVSRGTLNMAIAPLVGSMLATIIVSVLPVGSGGRWSVPTMSTLRRPVPFHGTTLGAGGADAAALAAGADDAVDDAPADTPGVPVGRADAVGTPGALALLVIAVRVS